MDDGRGRLLSFGELVGQRIAASDGAIGSVADLYVDELSWTVRYLVADTGS